MKGSKKYAKYIIPLIFILFVSCIEEFIPENISFESLLVVDATLTNEYKFHTIILSRTFPFEEAVTYEVGADVKIVDEFNNEYAFNETERGIYESSEPFAVQSKTAYKLKITTFNGSLYESAATTLPSTTAQITELSYNNTFNSDNEEGIEILVDSFDPSGNSKYYRYTFEETQRIVVPDWGPQEIIVISATPPFEVTSILNTRNNRTCYKTTISNSAIVQTQSVNFSEDRITKFPVKFISKTDSIIRDRYSILVKQHVQSLEAYTYYKTLDELSSSESIFSENQPGFLAGNIFSPTNADEKVIGLFELNAVSEKRLFLNYRDVFPDANRLPFFVSCGIGVRTQPALVDPYNQNFSPLIDLLSRDRISFYSINEDFFGNPIEDPPFTVTLKECGDCTYWGSNIRPDFWVD